MSFFLEKKISLGLAESCTGGGLGASFVKFSQVSNYFLGSIVAYSNSAKIHILGVSPQTLLDYGAVSYETAKEMAKGAEKIFHCDYAL